jgi:hypothetical protein
MANSPREIADVLRAGPNENFGPPELRSPPARRPKIARCDAPLSLFINLFYMKHPALRNPELRHPPKSQY